MFARNRFPSRPRVRDLTPPGRLAAAGTAATTAAALVVTGGVATVATATPASAEPVTVTSADFTDGTTGDWTASGSATLEVVGDPDAPDNHVLSITRAADYEGIQSPTGIFEAGATYDFSMRARIAPESGSGTQPASTDLRFVMKPDYTWIGNTTVSGEWTSVTGTFTAPVDADPATLQAYIGTADQDAPYTILVDDILVTTGQDGEPGPGTVPGGAVDPVPTPVHLAEGTGDVSALTFDDGPNPGTTPALLDYLAEREIRAVFCVIGQNIRADGGAEILRRVVDEGHTLCNHSTGYADMGGWTAEQVRADMVENLRIIRETLGDPDAAVPFWRAPNGSWGATPEVAVELGMQPLAVRNTIADWETQDEAVLTDNLRAAMVPGELVLAHDGGGDRSGTLAAVRTVVDERLADGWEFVFPQGTPPASDGGPPVEEITPIKDTTAFPVGVAIDSRETAGTAGELTARHFDQITGENHMKPESWYDEAGTFRRHPEATAMMDFAAANDLRVYGHVLTWHSQTPEWFFTDDAGDPLPADAAGQEILRERLRAHIFGIAENLAADYGPFGSDTNPLVAWDVVNEVVSDGNENPDGLRRSEWFRILGEDFVDLSFRYADEAFNETYAAEASDTVPERPVTLFINDYNTEQSGKQDRYRALVERMLDRGVPLDGVGHQFHVNLTMPVGALATALDRFADLPVTQAVTELDVPTGTPVTQAGLIDQGYYYRDAFRVFRERADLLYAVTVWGLTDGRSWRADSGAPLLFDDAYRAKPAYHGVVDGELPATLRTADVFAGDVPLDDTAAAWPGWRKLPLHTFETAGGTAGFQLRWAPDHLTAFVSVDDPTASGDAVTLEVDGASRTVARDGSGEVPAVASEREGGYDVVVQVPLDAAAEGDTLGLDVRVSDGGAAAGAWNSPGTLGTLSLVEELSSLEVPAAVSAPEIDGVADAGYAAATPVTTAKAVEGDAGAEATVSTAWHGSTLYVLAEVADPVIDVSGSDPWVQDSVEIYVDAGNAKNGGYRPDDTQIRISAGNAVSFGTGDEAAQDARLTSAVREVEGGYVVEAAVDLLTYGGAGTFHGVDFQVNDAADGARTAIRNWADPTGTGYQSTARWGVAQLVAADTAECVKGKKHKPRKPKHCR